MFCFFFVPSDIRHHKKQNEDIQISLLLHQSQRILVPYTNERHNIVKYRNIILFC